MSLLTIFLTLKDVTRPQIRPSVTVLPRKRPKPKHPDKPDQEVYLWRPETMYSISRALYI